jgi:calcium-independent phospholipase A2-gamma
LSALKTVEDDNASIASAYEAAREIAEQNDCASADDEAGTEMEETPLGAAATPGTAAPSCSPVVSSVPTRGLRILTLDGGGMRGLLILEMLKKIEAETGRCIWELFDLVCGTSTGGFIALSIASRKSLEEIAAQYDHIRTSFQSQYSILTEVKRVALGAAHSADHASGILMKYFGEGMMSDLPPSPKVFVVCAAVDQAPAQPYVFRSYELSQEAFSKSELLGTSKVKIFEACQATVAAPTYYTPAVVGGQKMCDGALVANNPVLIGLAEAATLWPNTPVELVVSIGTGTNVPVPHGTNLVSWAKSIVDLCMNCYVPHKVVSSLLGSRYFRLDTPGQGDVDLSEFSPERLEKMLAKGRMYIMENEALFSNLRLALGIQYPVHSNRMIRSSTRKSLDSLNLYMSSLSDSQKLSSPLVEAGSEAAEEAREARATSTRNPSFDSTAVASVHV